MTIGDARPAGPRHARSEPFTAGQQFAPGRPFVPVVPAHEPPAGLGPWVPPLPVPERGLTRTAGAGLAALVVALVIGTIAMVGLNVHSATAQTEVTYLSAVRANSSLGRASDNDLVTAGHTVCSALDRQPSSAGLVGVFAGLTRTTGWSAGDAAAVVGSAVGAFCPGHRALIGR